MIPVHQKSVPTPEQKFISSVVACVLYEAVILIVRKKKLASRD